MNRHRRTDFHQGPQLLAVDAEALPPEIKGEVLFSQHKDRQQQGEALGSHGGDGRARRAHLKRPHQDEVADDIGDAGD